MTNIEEKYEKVGFDVKKKGVRYIPFRVRYVSKQMRVRLIPHSFYIIVSEESEFEFDKLRKVHGELKNGVQNNPTQQKQKHVKNGIWEVGEAVRNGAQAFFPW